ncbi:hypothetical protein SGM_4888 [Streptomyces griseoaurantiacus M045]|uniref:Uncharacterized protein n=1 Tax=Streptomyces griseoaurantiacus M045 TaxID=996637 RepID=F3NP24_9ACTN|nr:hypothetical protein SGM_4888 [Streptomyces griseoaurantiacus M045]
MANQDKLTHASRGCSASGRTVRHTRAAHGRRASLVRGRLGTLPPGTAVVILTVSM